jgi:hypothetical protein
MLLIYRVVDVLGLITLKCDQGSTPAAWVLGVVTWVLHYINYYFKCGNKNIEIVCFYLYKNKHEKNNIRC